ncbi:LuxR C-terminal-related transcriptional regulator [Streptomyces sp. NPDC102405]|uniref:LuxR C-terminal-related transcriptional regulator n=1 Tax=Streptomyces sp. NPDC102405 TaxID=3366170 RepID=UPI0038272A10
MRRPGVPGQRLSPGQLAALRLAGAGYTSRQIAVRLETTEQAIHLRLQEAVVRLGARSRTHAVVIALRRRLVRFDELELPDTAPDGPRGAPSSPLAASDGFGGDREGRGAPGASEGRTGDPGPDGPRRPA